MMTLNEFIEQQKINEKIKMQILEEQFDRLYNEE